MILLAIFSFKINNSNTTTILSYEQVIVNQIYDLELMVKDPSIINSSDLDAGLPIRLHIFCLTSSTIANGGCIPQ